MKLLRHREKINTECSFIEGSILNVKAIKIDAQHNSLKKELGCKNLKSCDYFKRDKKSFYFIEISDFHQQFFDLKASYSDNEASKIIKDEIRLKLSETLLLYNQLIQQFNIKQANINLKNKALLTVCRDSLSDAIIFAKLERELTRHYCPTHLASIKVIPYPKLETILK
ncbi:MAG: hypothetical protein U9N49_02615 [Campylobacterota bacterium]|nr:hypothetical protein [Campylobacterota bacterium]